MSFSEDWNSHLQKSESLDFRPFVFFQFAPTMSTLRETISTWAINRWVRVEAEVNREWVGYWRWFVLGLAIRRFLWHPVFALPFYAFCAWLFWPRLMAIYTPVWELWELMLRCVNSSIWDGTTTRCRSVLDWRGSLNSILNNWEHFLVILLPGFIAATVVPFGAAIIYGYYVAPYDATKKRQ